MNLLQERHTAELKRVRLAAHWTPESLGRWRAFMEEARSSESRMLLAEFESEAARPVTKPPSELLTAYHEAGHAVAFAHLGFVVESVSIIPNETSRGRVITNPPDPWISSNEEAAAITRELQHKRMVGLFAGHAAASIAKGESPLNHRAAFRLLESEDSDGAKLVALAGTLATEDKPASFLLVDSFVESVRLLQENWLDILNVVAALSERPELSPLALHCLQQPLEMGD